MRHSFLDRYRQGTSLIHRLDPRLKLLATLVFVLAVTATPPGNWIAFALLAALAVGAVLVARVPLVEGIKRSAVFLPFAGMVAISLPFTQDGEVVWNGPDPHHLGSRRQLAGAKKDRALWLKWVDPDEREGERFAVYEHEISHAM